MKSAVWHREHLQDFMKGGGNLYRLRMEGGGQQIVRAADTDMACAALRAMGARRAVEAVTLLDPTGRGADLELRKDVQGLPISGGELPYLFVRARAALAYPRHVKFTPFWLPSRNQRGMVLYAEVDGETVTMQIRRLKAVGSLTMAAGEGVLHGPDGEVELQDKDMDVIHAWVDFMNAFERVARAVNRLED